MKINVSDLCFRYPAAPAEKRVLNGLDAEFDEGKIHVLLGRNGSGKTTLLKLLAGLEIPTNGSILYGGTPLRKISVRDRARRFSYVAQNINQDDGRLVREYLLLSTVGRIKFYERPGKEEEERVQRAAEMLGITDLLDREHGSLSGGERQKTAIAAAVVQDADCILLDEPTASLDVCSQYEVLGMLKKLRDSGKTVLLSDHNPNHALALDAEVCLLDKGTITDRGPARETVTPEKLKAVYGEGVVYSSDLPYSEISFRSERG